MKTRNRLFALSCATLCLLAPVVFVACSPEEVTDEAKNHIHCDQMCEWAVDCGRTSGSIDACDDDCEAKADQSEMFERQVQDCADCIDHTDLTCEQNDELCSDVCAAVAPPLTDG
jgi:hypothetical protein